MNISVWDTYVKRDNNHVMHFDILVPDDVNDPQTILDFGTHYLQSKPFKTSVLSARECRFCHIEKATEEIITSITKKGYAIIEMENCN